MDTPIPATWKRWLLTVVAVVTVVAGVVVHDRLFREVPAPRFESDENHFLYGSIGAESREGVPCWIWLVLPRIFPDLLPGVGGYASLGIVSKDGRELPVGFSKVTIGYAQVAPNCAFCHAASIRTRPDDLPTIVPGAPAHQTVAQEYIRFLSRAAADPRFSAGTILGEIAKNTQLSTLDRLLFRFVVIPSTRGRLLRLGRDNAWMNDQPAWGPGRADVLNPIKFQRLGQRVDSTVGVSDMMPLWNMAQRESHGLFWDGLNTSLQDAVVTSALSTGATRPWLDADISKWDATAPADTSSLRRIQNYMTALKPPAYPFPVDKTLAASGQVVYQTECAQCHAQAGATTDAVQAASLDTDRRRSAVWTANASTAFSAFSARRAWTTARFREGGAYVSVPLDGLWVRAPYLHNGSVPTLSDLLNTAPARPARFWRGYDVYDPVNVGFISDGPDAQREGTLHDTSQPGNGNGGHAFGTGLPAESKRALIEYLKTL